MVPCDHAQRGTQTPGDPALAGGGDQRQIAGARNGQEQDDGGDKGAVVRDAKKHGLSFWVGSCECK